MNPPQRSTQPPRQAFSNFPPPTPTPPQTIQDLLPPSTPPLRKSPIFILVLTLHILIITLVLWIPKNTPETASIHMMEIIDLPSTQAPEEAPSSEPVPSPTPSPPPPTPTPPPPPTQPPTPPLPNPPPPKLPSPTPPPAPTPKPIPPKNTPPKPPPPPTPPQKSKPTKPKIEISKEVVQKPTTTPKEKKSKNKTQSTETKNTPNKSSPQKASNTHRSNSTATQQDFTSYYSLIRERMNRVWKQPVQYAYQEPSAVIRIRLSNTGRILSATLEESSGIEEFDQSALNAALEAKEIGAARPVGMPESITITFRLDGSN